MIETLDSFRISLLVATSDSLLNVSSNAYELSQDCVFDE